MLDNNFDVLSTLDTIAWSKANWNFVRFRAPLLRHSVQLVLRRILELTSKANDIWAVVVDENSYRLTVE